MKKHKRIIAFILTFMMIFGTLPSLALNVAADDTSEYIDCMDCEDCISESDDPEKDDEIENDEEETTEEETTEDTTEEPTAEEIFEEPMAALFGFEDDDLYNTDTASEWAVESII